MGWSWGHSNHLVELMMGMATKNPTVAQRHHSAINVLPAVSGMNRRDTLVDVCHKQARPIIMTMDAGMLRSQC